MTRLEFQRWLDQFPEDTEVNILNGTYGLSYPYVNHELFRPDDEFMYQYFIDSQQLYLGDSSV